MYAICRAGCHRMCPTKIFGHSEYVGRKGAIDNAKPDADACTVSDGDTDASSDAQVKMSHLGFVTSYSHSSIVLEIPTAPFFYQGGSMRQPPSHGVENTRWEARMAPHSNKEEGDGE
ncbi:hypothetical protein J1N35_014930 [Gossypium stocksii]|uniref:Uncharacterized protein n=1 Tax=Gossypium stocksii TaxID=47602 RepID=A0A9D3VXZ9_9ROSI|nr:hypothetical protein J1N35_014930 [Gossypium stocksii]